MRQARTQRGDHQLRGAVHPAQSAGILGSLRLWEKPRLRLVVSLNESKLSSVICADSGSELNMKTKLDLEENRPTLAGYGQGHYDSLGEACPPVQQTGAELCPARRVGTTGPGGAQAEVALELTSLLPAGHCESIRNTRCLSMPYQSHHPQLVATSQDGGPWGFLQKLQQRGPRLIAQSHGRPHGGPLLPFWFFYCLS